TLFRSGGLGDDVGVDDFAEQGVGLAHDGGLAHTVHALDELFDLPGADTVRAGLDLFADAAGDEQTAVLVEVTQVTGVQPAALQRAGGVFRRGPVALHHIGALGANLADLAGRQQLAVFVLD